MGIRFRRGSGSAVLSTVSLWLTGIVDPTAADGLDGDWFFNETTGMLFGPKAAGAWPTYPAKMYQPRLPLQFLAGDYIGPQGMSSTGATGLDATNLTVPFMRLAPLYIPQDGTIDRGQFEVVTTPGEGGSTGYPVLFKPDNTVRRGMPGSFAINAATTAGSPGAVSTATTGVKNIDFTAVSVLAGWYWSGIVWSSVAVTRPTYRTAGLAPLLGLPVGSSQTGAIIALSYAWPGAVGSLAAVDLGLPAGGTCPLVRWKYAVTAI